MFRPVCPRSSLSQLNFIWGRKTSVDCEISIIDFLGVECRKYRERESKKKRISSAHKYCPRGLCFVELSVGYNFSLLYQEISHCALLKITTGVAARVN